MTYFFRSCEQKEKKVLFNLILTSIIASHVKPINLIFPHLPEENIISVYIKSNYVKVYTHRGENVTPREFVFTKNINLSTKKKKNVE